MLLRCGNDCCGGDLLPRNEPRLATRQVSQSARVSKGHFYRFEDTLAATHWVGRQSIDAMGLTGREHGVFHCELRRRDDQ
jgi:hypothetical protein